MKYQAVSGLLSLAITATAPSYAQVGHDNCASAPSISGTGEWVWVNVGATTDGPPCGAQSFFDDVWFDWTAPWDGLYEVETCDNTTIDTVVAVYAGTQCPPASALACNDNGCGTQSYLTFQASGGGRYKIRVGGAVSGAEGGGTVGIRLKVPNDVCERATTISGTGLFPCDNTGASDHAPNGCGTIRKDIWYEWTAPAAGDYRVSTCGLTTMDTFLVAGYGSCSQFFFAECNDDTCFDQAEVLVTADAGETFILVLGMSHQSSDEGPFAFRISTDSPPNDDCADAQLAMGEGVHPFSTAGATTSGPAEPSCGFSGGSNIYKDVWFRWIPAESGTYDLSTCGASFDTRMALYAGDSCQTAAPLGCDDSSCPGSAARMSATVVGGAPYLVRIGSTSGNQGTEGVGQLAITRTAPSATSLGTPYCVAGPNSAHPGGAQMHAFGSTSLADQFLLLSASDVPPNRPGLFYYGGNQIFAPFGDGFRCVGGATWRLYPFVHSTSFGEAQHLLDFGAPAVAPNVVAGSAWSFQLWYRDPMGGAHGFNLSNGLELLFVP